MFYKNLIFILLKLIFILNDLYCFDALISKITFKK